MDLTKLFEAQAILDRDIESHHPVEENEDRLSKKILALLVELGECANEWRGFKFWSSYQGEDANDSVCEVCNGEGFFDYFNPVDGHSTEDCENCDGTGFNPLLLEYVDCLHFILSIGNEKIGWYAVNMQAVAEDLCFEHVIEEKNIVSQFNSLFLEVGALYDAAIDGAYDIQNLDDAYLNIVRMFIGLGEMLGFTWDQIEQAYFEKNKINFERQENGY